MDKKLQHDRQNFNTLFSHVVRLANHFYQQKDSIPPGRLVGEINFSDLPEQGLGGEAALSFFEKHFADKMANSAGPRYFGFVTGGSTPASVAGDWLVSVYDQVMSGGQDSIAPHLERQTIHFLKQLFKLDTEYAGSFVTGATMANFVGLATARQWIGEQHGHNYSQDGLFNVPPIRVLSATPHSSILKSLSMMGMGRNSWVKIDTLAEREAIDLEKLENYFKENPGPAIVVGNAGTVNTVDFDDFEAIGKLKSRYNFWLHVDAAFGGFAVCSEKFEHLMRGVHHADSITIDAHKWLNVPYDAAMQFTRHRDLQIKVFQNQGAAYLGDPAVNPDFMHITPENSRRFRALPSWFSLMAYGREGYRDIVERNCQAATQLGEFIKQSKKFRLLAPVKMNVVCFTLAGVTLSARTIKDFLDAVRDDGQVFFTPTNYKGTPAIRAAISNWQTENQDIEKAIEVLDRLHNETVTTPSYA